MTEDHQKNKPEPADDLKEITNQPNSTALKDNQQRMAAVPTTYTSGGNLLFHVTQLATARKDHVTFWSLPREVRDLIWSEVLGSEDDIFQANVITSVCHRKSKARAPAPANGYETLRPARRDDGRFTRTTYADILLSSRPPLPLAHLCQESRAFALQKYDAAYSKARGPDLNQERGSRFRWLSRYAARIMTIKIPDLDYNVADIKVPLEEDEPLIVVCWPELNYNGLPPGNLETEVDRLKLNALLELLKKAKDYQIMICVDTTLSDPFLVDRNIARNWGVFADRASGEDFAENRANKLLRDLNRRGRTVDMRGLGLSRHIIRGNTTWMAPRMGLLAPIIKSGFLPYFTEDGFRRLEEEELFPNGYKWTNLKDREWLQKALLQFLEPFEKLWAENVNEKETSSQSRYGRMPKIGLVFEYDIGLTWSAFQREIAREHRLAWG
ncbi:hypothetical protein B0H65DRAFT_442162 [Neurospora tetraspora]|uniref:2EXR domain-containing protein n=1 Tax=Neurospora tetraspora TaxID=94610 RepID=A0AAE0MR61_9PEZI|nr:hypothetical protein B0H65DRAFT_442162 [Neurospora tetraspora]